MDGGGEDARAGVRHPLGVFGHPQRVEDFAELFEALSGPERVELAQREANGISVALYWTRATNVLTVAVADTTSAEYFELVLSDHERPLDVFYHPFAYAHARGVGLAADSTVQGVVLDAFDF